MHVSRKILLKSLSVFASTITLPGIAHVASSSDDIYFYAEVNTDTSMALINAIHAKTLELTPTDEWVDVHIQSHGGNVASAFHLCDFINSYSIPIHTHVEGIAASAASLIAVSGQFRTMTQHSVMLLHQPSMKLNGDVNYAEIRDENYNLQLILDEMIDIYSRRSRLSKQSAKKIIMNEQYLTAGDCLKYGLVDKVI
jgi:ATP-dependent Clp protease protease subunit